MAFKLNDPRPNVLKSKGLLNKSPFKANGNTMAYNNGEPTDKTKLKKTMNAAARPSYDADSVKANKEVRTKEFNATPEGRAMADKMQILSGAMGTQKGQSSGPNKGKFFYTDQSKDPGFQTVYFTKDDYKKLADDYAQAKYQFSVPRNEAMKIEHGDVASYTDRETGDVQDYGEFYGNAGGDRFENIGKKVVEVDRPNASNNIINKE
jgi:hypothetical protein